MREREIARKREIERVHDHFFSALLARELFSQRRVMHVKKLEAILRHGGMMNGEAPSSS